MKNWIKNNKRWLLFGLFVFLSLLLPTLIQILFYLGENGFAISSIFISSDVLSYAATMFGVLASFFLGILTYQQQQEANTHNEQVLGLEKKNQEHNEQVLELKKKNQEHNKQVLELEEKNLNLQKLISDDYYPELEFVMISPPKKFETHDKTASTASSISMIIDKTKVPTFILDINNLKSNGQYQKVNVIQMQILLKNSSKKKIKNWDVENVQVGDFSIIEGSITQKLGGIINITKRPELIHLLPELSPGDFIKLITNIICDNNYYNNYGTGVFQFQISFSMSLLSGMKFIENISYASLNGTQTLNDKNVELISLPNN